MRYDINPQRAAAHIAGKAYIAHAVYIANPLRDLYRWLTPERKPLRRREDG